MGLFDLFSNDASKDAAAAKKAGLNAGLNAGTRYISGGIEQARPYYEMADTQYSRLFDMAMPGYQAYADATGAGGQEGMDRAFANFQNTPGYKSMVNEAIDGNDRRMASRGMLGSGNTIDATARLAGDLANRSYGDYVSRLSPFLGQSMQAGAGRAGVQQNIGQLYNQGGYAQGNMAFNTEKGMGEADAAAELARYNAAQNGWGALFGAANLGTKLFGMM